MLGVLAMLRDVCCAIAGGLVAAAAATADATAAAAIAASSLSGCPSSGGSPAAQLESCETSTPRFTTSRLSN